MRNPNRPRKPNRIDSEDEKGKPKSDFGKPNRIDSEDEKGKPKSDFGNRKEK